MKTPSAVKVSYDKLHASARLSGITPGQAEALWLNLQPKADETPAAKFDAENVAYYFGALIIIGAMGWFMTNAWDFLDAVLSHRRALLEHAPPARARRAATDRRGLHDAAGDLRD